MTPKPPDAPASRVISNRDAAFADDQFVVSLPYATLVLDELAGWAPGLAEQVDAHAGLGLALLSVRAADAVSALEGIWPDDVPGLREGRDGPLSDLEVVMRALRTTFSRQYAGWVPTMGKNRVMARLAGSYVIDIIGNGRPRKEPAYVIDITGTKPKPDYVIDITGTDDPDPVTDEFSVAPRGDAPGRGARIGLVDTRLTPHPWLAGGYVASAATLLPTHPEEAIPFTSGHATFITGLLLRQAPGAVVEIHCGLEDDGTTDSWRVAKQIADLAQDSPDVVNLSLGCTTEDGEPPLVLMAAINALDASTVVVAAAGNHATADDTHVPKPSWPAALDNVVAVGAVDGRRERADFSPDVPWVDALALGVGVVSTSGVRSDGRGDLARWDGTSFATAVVSGAIAAGLGSGRTARQVWDALAASAETVDGRPYIELTHLESWPLDVGED